MPTAVDFLNRYASLHAIAEQPVHRETTPEIHNARFDRHLDNFMFGLHCPLTFAEACSILDRVIADERSKSFTGSVLAAAVFYQHYCISSGSLKL